jgi:hypothetical protein
MILILLLLRPQGQAPSPISGSLAHPLGEGWGEGRPRSPFLLMILILLLLRPQGQAPSPISGSLAHPMGEGWGEGRP